MPTPSLWHDQRKKARCPPWLHVCPVRAMASKKVRGCPCDMLSEKKKEKGVHRLVLATPTDAVPSFFFLANARTKDRCVTSIGCNGHAVFGGPKKAAGHAIADDSVLFQRGGARKKKKARTERERGKERGKERVMETKSACGTFEASSLVTEARIVRLNVGGRPFVTYAGTLRAHPDCLLARMLDGGFSAPALPDGSLFVDRNGDRFVYVLDYLRDGDAVALPVDPTTLAALCVDADYLGLPGLVALVDAHARPASARRVTIVFASDGGSDDDKKKRDPCDDEARVTVYGPYVRWSDHNVGSLIGSSEAIRCDRRCNHIWTYDAETHRRKYVSYRLVANSESGFVLVSCRVCGTFSPHHFTFGVILPIMNATHVLASVSDCGSIQCTTLVFEPRSL